MFSRPASALVTVCPIVGENGQETRSLHERAAGTLGDAQRAHNRVMEKLSTGPEQLVSSEEVIIK
jgi:hypothetical protein